MKVKELNREEIMELKERYYTEKNENVSYGELADIDNVITDKEIFEYYADIDFVKEDFFVNIDKRYNYDYDIRKDLEDIISDEDRFYYEDFINGFSDLQMLRLATELLKNVRDSFGNDLYNLELKTDYTKLYNITNGLDNIIKKYL